MGERKIHIHTKSMKLSLHKFCIATTLGEV